MEYNKISNLLFLKIIKVNNYLNLLINNMLKLIVCLMRIMKMKIIDLKHLC